MNWCASVSEPAGRSLVEQGIVGAVDLALPAAAEALAHLQAGEAEQYGVTALRGCRVAADQGVAEAACKILQ